MDARILRILDASANRAREALRVLEDAVRFCWDQAVLARELKELRHGLAAALARLPMRDALAARDTPGDVGTAISTSAEFARAGLLEILAANCKRLTEALRSLEEYAKSVDPAAARELEQLRYRAYTAEQAILAAAAQADSAERFRKVRVYVLLTESLCTLPWEKVLDEVLAAGSAAGVQLREKTLPDGDLFRRAQLVATRCRSAGALSIMNDRADIARAAGCDGVHIGQTDMPCGEVRRLLGPAGIVGVSTESLDQARQAVAQGATYVAAGPMFPTTTKEKPRIAGPGYAAEVIREIPRPIVAIGGITAENLGQLTATGVTCVAVSAAVLRSPRPGEVVRQLLEGLNR